MAQTNESQEQVTVNVETLQPVTRTLMTIGALPTSYLISMTYEEQLLWLQNYLIKTVIPAINNNAEATQEVQDIVMALQDYINTQFSELNLQEYIDNKLDEMLESGVFENILMDYVQLTKVYDTYNDMITDASTFTNGMKLKTMGYHFINDGGGAEYVVTNVQNDNKYQISIGTNLWIEMITNGINKPEQFGALGDGNSDDTTAIQNAINYSDIINFNKKTYICYNLLINKEITLNGNNCVFKRPNLLAPPYNFTQHQLSRCKTLKIQESCNINDIIFDNNCFEYWDISQGDNLYLSASCELYNPNGTTLFTVNFKNCKCYRSASDGILITNNFIANINNFTSEDCKRGGITITGYSQVSIENWNSFSSSLADGFNVEMASAASGLYPLSINANNIVLDSQLKVQAPTNSRINLNNITQRPFDQDSKRGFTFSSINGGKINVSNSFLRGGVPSNAQILLQGESYISIDNCHIIGNTENPIFYLLSSDEGRKILNVNNCYLEGLDVLQMGVGDCELYFDGCNVNVTRNFLHARGNTAPQPKKCSISNCSIKFGTTLFSTNTLSSVTWDEGVNFYLSNLELSSDDPNSEIYLAGTPTIWFNNLIMKAGCVLRKQAVANPKFYGHGRIIIVDSAESLTFPGWVPNDDIAIIKDTNTKYRYISGTTWQQI